MGRGLFGGMFAEHKDVGVLDSLPGFLTWGPAKSGQTVSYDTALQISTVLACCQVLCNGIAQVPWQVMKRRASGLGADPDPKHPLYPRLNRRPNDFQTSFEFRQTLVLHLTLARNAFVFLSRGPGGKILELIPIEPGRVTVTRRPDLSLIYTVTSDQGASRTFTSQEIWHLRGLSWNGWMGLEFVKLAREALGLSLALEEAHARLHQNGAQPSGTYSVEGKLTEDQHKKMTAWIKENAAAAARGNPLVIDNGAKWLSQQMTGVDAEHLATRQFQVIEICRQMNVQPMMVMAVDKPTYASAEQLFNAHDVHTLTPIAENIEQSADVYLLGVEDDTTHYTHLDFKGLRRGSMKDQADAHAKALGSGGHQPWMSQDEVRDAYDLPPMGGAAATLQAPVNAPAPTTPPKATTPETEDAE